MNIGASVRSAVCAALACAETLLCTVYAAAFRDPLRHLYFHGPAWHGAGFWQGMSDADMCAQMTTVDAAFWGQHADDCTLLLERRFHSFALAVHALMLLFMTYRVAQIIWWRFCIAPFYHSALRTCFSDVAQALERHGVSLQRNDLAEASLPPASLHLSQDQKTRQ